MSFIVINVYISTSTVRVTIPLVFKLICPTQRNHSLNQRCGCTDKLLTFGCPLAGSYWMVGVGSFKG